MESICPKCGKHIEHEDFLFEVSCDCGSRFNPFLLLEGQNGGELESQPEAAAAGAEGFSESAQAFQEIAQYGENLADPSASTPAPETPPAGASIPSGGSQRHSVPAAQPQASARETNECPMTAGDGFPGWQIEAYYMPISAMTDLDPGSESPLGPALRSLWAQAQKSGGNGVVSLRWTHSADLTRVLVSGTPVRLTRQA